MPSITIRDLPDGLHARLRERAARHRRSLNAEIVHTLDEATAPRADDPEATIARLRQLRARTRTSPLTEVLWREAESGRP